MKWINRILVFIVLMLVFIPSIVLAGDKIVMLSPEDRDQNDPMVQMQREVDQYIFNDHFDELNDMGFQATYTLPMDGYVEIGIIPFSKKNAKILYDVFGDDSIKVVAGEKVAAMGQIVDSPSDFDSNEQEYKTPYNIYIIPIFMFIIFLGFILYFYKKKKL